MRDPFPSELFPITTQRLPDGTLEIGGCRLGTLAERYDTPLYLYDQPTMDDAVHRYQATLDEHWPGRAEVAYAAKAWLSLALAAWAAERGLGMDVVSEGELRHALHGGFPAARIHAHGNNKPDSFLRACVQEGVARVVIDHSREALRLARICEKLGRTQDVWLRLNPASAAKTHSHMETGSITSKFGLNLADGSALEVARFIIDNQFLTLRGVHFHIGSQFSDTGPLQEAIRHVCEWLAEVKRELDWQPEEFSPGGGWAVPYRPGDPVLTPEEAIPSLARTLRAEFDRHGLPIPSLVLEPGRELVARAGVALYRVGALKQAGAVRYAFVDGGLADNPRPALYGAGYHAVKDGVQGKEEMYRYTLAGPFCESGDVLIHEVMLPRLEEGNLLAVPVSGAYQLSMDSNYNGAARPAVVWLYDGKTTLIRRREPVEALWEHELPLGGTSGKKD